MHLLFDQKQNRLVLLVFTPQHMQALLDIAKNADPAGVPEATQRLFPAPVSADEDDVGSTIQDWAEISIPELKEEFSSAIQTVMEDLKHLEQLNLPMVPADEQDDEHEDEDEEALENEEPAKEALLVQTALVSIPVAHVEAWYSAMNQARLVMVEKNLFVDDNGNVRGEGDNHLAYEFYTELQSHLLGLMHD